MGRGRAQCGSGADGGVIESENNGVQCGETRLLMRARVGTLPKRPNFATVWLQIDRNERMELTDSWGQTHRSDESSA